jgi:hypothetical protein
MPRQRQAPCLRQRSRPCIALTGRNQQPLDRCARPVHDGNLKFTTLACRMMISEIIDARAD